MPDNEFLLQDRLKNNNYEQVELEDYLKGLEMEE